MWSPSSFFLTHRKIVSFIPSSLHISHFGIMVFSSSKSPHFLTCSCQNHQFWQRPTSFHVFPINNYTLKTSLKDEGFKGDIITWKSHTNLDLFWGFSFSGDLAFLGIQLFWGFSSSFMDMYCIGHMYLYIYMYIYVIYVYIYVICI